MCRVRGYKHRCGHTIHQHLSYCRGTYATPSTETPLCHPSPSLTITIPDHCRSCEYSTFCAQWESRIAEAQSRQEAARQLLAEFGREWDKGGDADDEMMMEGLGFDDCGAASREKCKAEKEVDELWQQFQSEQWAAWRAFLTADGAGRRRRRQRRTSPRELGCSPLKMVTHSDEIPDDTYSGRLTRESSMVSTLDSEDNSPGSSPTSEPCYTPVGSADLGSWTPGCGQSWEEEDVFSKSWGTLPLPSPTSPVDVELDGLGLGISDDGVYDDDMLPNYG